MWITGYARVALVMLGAGMLGSTAHANESITILADPWCPHTCAVSDAQTGYMIEIAREALKPFGVDVKYEVMPWSRAIEMVRAGKYNAVAGAAKGDTPDFVFPKEEQGKQSMELWVKLDSTIRYTSPASLENIKIGIIADYFYGDVMDAYIQSYSKDATKIQSISGDHALELNLRKVTAGRVDATPEDASVIKYYYLSRNRPLDVKSAGMLSKDDSADKQNIYIAFSPQNPNSARYAQWMSKSMKEMRSSGRLAAILSRYGLVDWHADAKPVKAVIGGEK